MSELESSGNGRAPGRMALHIAELIEAAAARTQGQHRAGAPSVAEVPLAGAPEADALAPEAAEADALAPEEAEADAPTAVVPAAGVPSADASTPEPSMLEASTAEVPTAEVSSANASTAEPSMLEASTAEVLTAEASNANASTAEASTTEVPTAEVPSAGASTAEASMAEASMAEASTTEVPTAQFPSHASVAEAPIERRRSQDGPSAAISVDEASRLEHREFVDNACLTVLGRLPSAEEREKLLNALLSGDAKTWLLGQLRYSAEGRMRAIPITGLRGKYLAQRLFRLPAIGFLFRWLGALGSLPRSLRYLRGFAQSVAGEHVRAEQALALLRQQIDEVSGRLADLRNALQDRIARNDSDLRDQIGRLDEFFKTRIGQLDHRTQEFKSRIERLDHQVQGRIERLDAEWKTGFGQLEHQVRDRMEHLDSELKTSIGQLDHRVQHQVEHLSAELTNRIATLDRDVARIAKVAGDAKLRVDALSPPPLAETLEVIGGPLVEPARDVAQVRADLPVSRLSDHERYAVFEAAFYQSTLVAAKQRVYLRYLDGISHRQLPFVDLGCGRGEFLAILAGIGLPAVGVDVNPVALPELRAAGFEVAEQDLLKFLQSEHRMFSGASALQVVEHLRPAEIDSLLEMLAQRLVPGALLIIETPNPLCPFAWGQFHTDPTHITPLPPERLRFSVEAAGFTGARTLFQARVPETQFAGPDPRAYYMDYAIIAYRSGT